MKISRDKILNLILDHKQAFYVLLDYVSQNGGAVDIPQPLYLQQYNDVILNSKDESAKRILTLDSLSKNGIIVNLDNQANTLTLQTFVIDMLRFIDTSRVRELSEADFEGMRQQFQMLCERFEHQLNISPGLDEYDEWKLMLLELINTTLSKIQQNVEGLSANVLGLGKRYERLDAEGHTTLDSVKLLEDATKLYERFIKPCHEFLSPSMCMKDGEKSFTASMERLAELHDKRGHPEIGARIQYKLTAIRSYYKDIAELETIVRRYSRSLAEERHRYKVIEASYNQLLMAVSDLRHGKLRHTKLLASADVFTQHEFLKGLKKLNSKTESKLNWYDVQNKVRLDEFITSLSSISSGDENEQLSPLPISTDIAKERREIILKLVIQRNWLSDSEDIIKDVDCWLKDELHDHTLIDTLVGYQCCMSLPS